MSRLAVPLALIVAGPARADSETAAKALAGAQRALAYGDGEALVEALRPIAEDGGAALSSLQEPIEALRAYGIASALFGTGLLVHGMQARR
jgi:hypothetical protein